MGKTLSSRATDWREGRRLRAFELKQEGWKHKEIADALGVTKGAVSQWMKRARDEGVEGLRHKPPPGVRPRLSAEQRARLPETTRAFGSGSAGTRISWRGVDLREGGASDPKRVRRKLPPGARESSGQGIRAFFAQTSASGEPTRRGGHQALWKEERWPELKKGH